ncbi:MAG: alpha/beta fold hydrolase [Kofleriaceae bacterium]|nr:alpha/beta fold hydrolase [Myxococcales bacterium]MCB9564737.1 alpha/beta fold hydrolase [Kofleriaceae bacterium]MCB9572787.1 alpha/beta fold hydrolase [Kofleriaceae bacterium]
MSAALAQWRHGGRWFRHRGHAIFYRDDGAGPVLLALHGFPSASWDWHPMWPALTARFRVIAPDMIGFGWSAKPRHHAYSIDDQATLHERLLASLGVDRVHVLAHDYGDTVAQELLARHQERIRRGSAALTLASMCLLNGGLFPETHRPRPVQRILASRLGPVLERVVGKRGFAAGLTAVFGPATPPSPALIDELWTLLRHDDGHRVMHQLIGYMAERRAHRARWVGALVDTDVPLRLIDGVVDPVSGAHMVARYREVVPHPDVVELPGIGHYPQVEAPDAVLGAFVAFHDRLAATAAAPA